MKRLFVFIAFAFCLHSALKAEQPTICGDWINVSKYEEIIGEDNYGNYEYAIRYMKTIMRIKLVDGHYTIRTKSFSTHKPEDVSYGLECTITNANNDSISWTTEKRNANWYKDSGERGGYFDTDRFLTAVLINGTLKVSGYSISTYYNKSGHVIDDKKKFIYSEETYYKEDLDW